jgi:hypothetical protein
VLGYYYFARKQWGFTRSSAEWKPFGWGFAAVTVGFGLFNMAVNGRFFFFANAMGTAAKLMVRHNPYVDVSYGWLRNPVWLVLPLMVLVGAIVCLRRRRRVREMAGGEFILFWMRFYVVAVGILVFFQLIGQPILQLPHYSSYFMPGVFLALGGMFGVATREWSRTRFVLVLVAVLAVSVWPLVLRVDSGVMEWLQQHAILPALVLGIVGVLILGRSQVSGGRSQGTGHGSQAVAALAVVVFAVGVAALNAGTSPRTWDHGELPNDAGAQKAAMLAIADSARAVKELDPQGNLYFWYDAEGRLGKVFRAVASTYLWAYRLESEKFPELGTKAPPVGRRIVILTEDGERGLAAGEASLARAGLAVKFVGQRTIREGPFAWEMVEVELVSPELRAPGTGKNL